MLKIADRNVSTSKFYLFPHSYIHAKSLHEMVLGLCVPERLIYEVGRGYAQFSRIDDCYAAVEINGRLRFIRFVPYLLVLHNILGSINSMDICVELKMDKNKIPYSKREIYYGKIIITC